MRGGWKKRDDKRAALCPFCSKEVMCNDMTNLYNHLKSAHPEKHGKALAASSAVYTFDGNQWFNGSTLHCAAAPGAEHVLDYCSKQVGFLLKCTALCPNIAINRDMRYCFLSTINRDKKKEGD